MIREENLIKPTIEILERIYQNSQANSDEVFTRLFRYMLRPDIYFIAYKNLYANQGASTPGVDENDTADGFSEEKINRIIETLRNGSYEPRPVRRVEIAKKNGRKRPLGLPTFTDKLVQEVLRMILEAIYEPVFNEHSHGFRPNRSCHTALKEITKGFNGIRWFIEGDIKGCFDNINHHALIAIIGKKLKDARIIQLLWKFLRAGYLENWRYNATYSGTPQGGIISPILANIYLHELDKFVMKLKEKFDAPQKQRHTLEYNHAHGQVSALSKKIKRASGEEKKALIAKWRKARQVMLRTPAKSQTDKVIKYIRYADDFLIGVNGNRKECQEIREQIRKFMAEELHMELSEEKTLITHSSKAARFLGYDVYVRRCGRVKRTPRIKLPRRTLNNSVALLIPFREKIEAFMLREGIIGRKENGEIEPIKRKNLIQLTPLEIMQTYNSELRGICNYYCLASNFSHLRYFAYLMEYSCLKTLATKLKSSIGKVMTRYKDGQGRWGIPYETQAGKKRMYFADYRDSRKKAIKCRDQISNKGLVYANSRNSLEEKLKAKVCELCGSTDAEHYELHHIRKVKDLKGKEKWERHMIAKRRKTLVVCKECHKKIHGHNGNKR
ncbi:MAG: group II intron reverse transcriptase/maturase [Synergistaceae bacterium]|nr:group II intron reverse transcriptase/maturase [Synergistaceae bacterium]MBR0248668.1 group II intron reverse transcriptase/maturase [Synergistaceae bacterium]